MRVVEALAKVKDPIRFFESCQVASLKIFDERDLQHSPFVDLHFDAGDLREPGSLARVITALPGNNLVAAAHLANQDRLEYPLLLDRRDEIAEIAKALSRLMRIHVQHLDIDHSANRLGNARGGQLFDEVEVVPHLVLGG